MSKTYINIKHTKFDTFYFLIKTNNINFKIKMCTPMKFGRIDDYYYGNFVKMSHLNELENILDIIENNGIGSYKCNHNNFISNKYFNLTITTKSIFVDTETTHILLKKSDLNLFVAPITKYIKLLKENYHIANDVKKITK